MKKHGKRHELPLKYCRGKITDVICGLPPKNTLNRQEGPHCGAN